VFGAVRTTPANGSRRAGQCPPRGRAAGPRHVGHQQHAEHQILHRLDQGFGQREGLDLGEQLVGVFQFVGVEAAV